MYFRSIKIIASICSHGFHSNGKTTQTENSTWLADKDTQKIMNVD